MSCATLETNITFIGLYNSPGKDLKKVFRKNLHFLLVKYS